MGLFTLLLAADAPGPADDYWYTPRGEATVAGVAVSPDTAMGIAAVFSCVRVRAETVGMLPLHLYRREGRNKAIARDQEWYGILTRRPNPWQTASDFRQMMQSLREKLLALDDEIVVVPGHGPLTTIGRERERTPFLQPQ